ncbi:MAG: fasciclin domain-containing protein [Bacteroidota bacterium]
MKKVLYSFLWILTVGGFLFLTSCGEDGEDPVPGGNITLSTPDGDIVDGTLLAAPGADVEITASLGASSTDEISVVTNNASVVSVPTDNTITSGGSITVTVGASADLGDEATLTFTSGATTEQLTITVGYNTVVDAALANSDLSILVEALQAADLVTTLQGPGPFTVFAPTNNAFESLLTQLGATKEELLARDDLDEILLYHVSGVDPAAESGSLTDGQIVETLHPDAFSVLVSIDGNTVMINNATVTTADVTTGNGVVHIIDEVLLPQTVAEYEAVLLAAPIGQGPGERTSETFFSASSGETYSVDDVVAGTDGVSSADIDFGYYYGATNNASLAAPSDYPQQVYDLTSTGANWSALNETMFSPANNLTLDDFNAIGPADAVRLVLEYELASAASAPVAEITALSAGDLVTFKTVDDLYGIIRVLEIVDGDNDGEFFGSADSIELEIKVTQ